MSYYNLHLHTHYSTLDGCIKISELADRLIELGLPGSAITEHGNLHSLIEGYKTFQKKGLKFIPGIEAYLTEDSDNAEEKHRDNYHLVLLAKNNTGLENLVWLSTRAHLHNFYYKPRIWIKHLEDHSEGLIASSACLASVPSRHLRYESNIQKVFIDDYHDYVSTLHWFSEVFRGEYYLEVQDHDFWQQREYNKMIIEVARKEKIPLTITSDAHYLKKEDSYLHEMMMAMQFKQTLEEYRDGDNMKYGATNYVYSIEEMRASAKKWGCPEAIENTVRIADQVDVNIEFGTYHMPTFPVEDADDYESFLLWRQHREKDV